MSGPAPRESVLPIRQGDRPAFGILHAGAPDARLGVVVVVGGGQYRVGAHRQFVRLARFLAEHGVPTLRFDVRGMGDGGGKRRHFLDLGDDLRAAIDAFTAAEPALDGVVLWGLCDGASAAVLYADEDARVRGVALVNPWISTDEGVARTLLRHHYRDRLTDRAFWRRLLSGRVDLPDAIGSFAGTLRSALSGGRAAPAEERVTGDDAGHGIGHDAGRNLPDAVFAALEPRTATTLIVISGEDMTAREFEDELAVRVRDGLFANGSPPAIERLTADHTFSSPDAHAALCEASLRWIDTLARDARMPNDLSPRT